MEYKETRASTETDDIISIISHNNERGDHSTIEVKDGNDAAEDGNDPVVISILKRGDHATNEVEDGNDPVVICIREKLESLFPLSSKCCIYTIPEKLRQINAEAYTPFVVSIGPLHRGVERLQAMEEHKFRYLSSFVVRSGLSLEDYVKFIRKREEQVRSCYAENIKLGSDEFVQMILVDGCFLVELILRYYIFADTSTNNASRIFDMSVDVDHIFDIIDHVDRIFDKPRLFKQIKRDLLLLENQLPFFVLEDLFHHWRFSIGRRRDISFKELCSMFFKNLTNIDKLPDQFSGHEVKHLVHFLLLHYLPPSGIDKDNNYIPTKISPTATTLHEAGVKFKKGTYTNLHHIHFDKGVLEFSHLHVYDSTETVLRNLIAFEQCHCLDGTIMNYMHLMDGLINTPKDVDLLIKHKIITSHLGSSEDVTKMFNNICKEIYLSQNPYFRDLCEELNNYCETRQHRWRATFRRDYFNTPWKIVSTIAAVLLLALTFIQAACSILSA